MPGEQQSIEQEDILLQMEIISIARPVLSYCTGLLSNLCSADGSAEPLLLEKARVKLLRKKYNQKEPGNIKIKVENNLHFIKNLWEKDKEKKQALSVMQGFQQKE